MADKIKTASNVTERRGSSAIDRNIASNAEAVAAGMSVAAGSLILGALLPHRADAKNQADLPAGKTDPHPDAASHFVPQGDDAPPHVGQSAPTPAANPGTIDPSMRPISQCSRTRMPCPCTKRTVRPARMHLHPRLRP